MSSMSRDREREIARLEEARARRVAAQQDKEHVRTTLSGELPTAPVAAMHLQTEALKLVLGLPADMVICGLGISEDGKQIVLGLEWPKFPPITPGQPIPAIHADYERPGLREELMVAWPKLVRMTWQQADNPVGFRWLSPSAESLTWEQLQDTEGAEAGVVGTTLVELHDVPHCEYAEMPTPAQQGALSKDPMLGKLPCISTEPSSSVFNACVSREAEEQMRRELYPEQEADD